MSNFSNILKKGLLIGVFAILFLPIIQNSISLVTVPDLKGSIVYPDDILFSKEKWFTAEYQLKKEEYLNSMFGLRSLFVRANNQVSYSLFNKAKANGVIVGKENYLYEYGYIDAVSGKDFIGEDSVAHTVARMKFISDTLTKMGKQLIVIFAAGKGSFFPEFIPDSYRPFKKKTNYKLLSNASSEAGLHVIDFNKWFMDNKYKSKYPLYPQHGVHWSTYGTALAADSLIKKIESLRHIDIPNLKISTVKLGPAVDVDYDVADGMNLLFRLKGFDVAFPYMQIDDTVGKVKPKVLVISDSFYWGMYNLGIANCFSNDHFWYYNKQVYPDSYKQEVLAEQLNVGEEIQKHDVVIIMATEATVRKISWGFIEEAEKFYKGNYGKSKTDGAYFEKVKQMLVSIKANEKWLFDTKNRAKERGISLDSCLVLEAMWQIDNTKK